MIRAVFRVVRAEAFKLARLQKVNYTAAAVLIPPAALVLLVVLAWFRGRFFGFELITLAATGTAPKVVSSILATGFTMFLFTIWFFMAILVGELIPKEFEQKTIKLLLLAPAGRLELFLGKTLTVFGLYVGAFVVWLVGYATVFLAIRVLLGANLLHFVPIRDAIPVVSAFLVITGSEIALIVLIGTLTRSIESTLAYTVMASFLLRMAEGLLYYLQWLELITEPTRVWLQQYSYTATKNIFDVGQLETFFKGAGPIPVRYDTLAVNGAYTVLFLAIAYVIFARREETAP